MHFIVKDHYMATSIRDAYVEGGSFSNETFQGIAAPIYRKLHDAFIYRLFFQPMMEPKGSDEQRQYF